MSFRQVRCRDERVIAVTSEMKLDICSIETSISHNRESIVFVENSVLDLHLVSDVKELLVKRNAQRRKCG